MKWWAVPFLVVGPPLFLFGMLADADGWVFDLSFVAGATLFVAGVVLLFVLPYSSRRDELTARQDRVGVALIVGFVALIVSFVVWGRLTQQ